MKVLLAQQNYHIGNFESNTNKIIQAISNAKNEKADLIVSLIKKEKDTTHEANQTDQSHQTDQNESDPGNI
jgi:hypothetical protein